MMTEVTASMILALLATGRMSLAEVCRLRTAAGSAAAVMEHRMDIRVVEPEATDRACGILAGDMAVLQKRVEEEQQWCAANNVKIVTMDDECYPDRLRHCYDAPQVLFVRGKADLNAQHIINIVGTRKCTSYGQDVIQAFVRDLADLCPDLIIVSGLAYGVDISSHRAAMQYDLPTVGVVAHGQDTLYPSLHRNDANRMVMGNGAVVTEYFRATRPEARNFLQRNRIIAGMSDATLVVESASHGGGLVTARLAQEYNRDVFAVPGPVNAEFSMGCNNLIRDNKAALVSSASDIVQVMGWENAKQLSEARRKGIERQLFVELTPDEQRISDVLQQHGDSSVNDIVMHTGMMVSVVSSSLFTMEMKGVVKSVAGNAFHLMG